MDLSALFSRPIDAGPADVPVGRDELGNQIYRTVLGNQYVVRQVMPEAPQTQAGTQARVFEVLADLFGGAVDGAVQGVTAPARALRGEPVSLGDALSTAGLAAVGAAPGAAPAGALRMFAGRNARTADLGALARAENMLQAGADRNAVWQETGWFKGVDGQWRFEIDDSAFWHAGIQKQTIGETFKHDPLFEAYPHLRDVGYDRNFLPRNHFGSYSPGDEVSGIPDQITVSYTQQGNRELSAVLHELQHGVQRAEGFARGANTFGMSPEAVAIYKQIIERMRTPLSLENYARDAGFAGDIAAAKASYQDYLKTAGRISPDLDRAAQETAVAQAYRRAAGEVEARNVETRAGFTPEERRATPPWATQDVPDAEQLVRALSARR